MLVRSAHSANIKERRDCSTALFDAAGEMVMQAEHIPVHLGAMPAAVARRARPRPAPRRLVGPQRPLRAAAPTCPTSRSSRPPSTTASCSASRPPAPTTPTSAGACPARCRPTRPRWRRRASSSRRACSTTRPSTSSPRRCASPRTGAPTCAPSSPPTAPAPQRLGELADRVGLRLPARGDGGRARLRRAAHARVPRGPARRHAHGRRPARGGRGRPRAARGRHGRRRRADARLLGLGGRSTRATSTARWP